MAFALLGSYSTQSSAGQTDQASFRRNLNDAIDGFDTFIRSKYNVYIEDSERELMKELLDSQEAKACFDQNDLSHHQCNKLVKRFLSNFITYEAQTKDRDQNVKKAELLFLERKDRFFSALIDETTKNPISKKRTAAIRILTSLTNEEEKLSGQSADLIATPRLHFETVTNFYAFVAWAPELEWVPEPNKKFGKAYLNNQIISLFKAHYSTAQERVIFVSYAFSDLLRYSSDLMKEKNSIRERLLLQIKEGKKAAESYRE